MPNRRDFNSRMAGATLLSVGQVIPQFLANTVFAADAEKNANRERILVVIELTGGNDGLNTVIPYTDRHYQKARPKLAYRAQDVLKVDKYIGLHPSLRELENLRENGSLAIVQGVGYPNPDRSHFESMDIWHMADPTRQQGTGWIGRSFTQLHAAPGGIPGLYLGGPKLPLALTAHTGEGIALDKADDAQWRVFRKPNAAGVTTPKQYSDRAESYSPFVLDESTQSDEDDDANSTVPADWQIKYRQILNQPRPKADSLLQFVQRSTVQAVGSMEQVRAAISESFNENNYRYFDGGLFKHLSWVAFLINKELSTRFYYLSLNGFDTHGDQREEHARLLESLARSIKHFFEILGEEHQDRVVIMTFSEFGRRVQENGSNGTDHGAASSMFVLGKKVRGGLLGKYPSLAPADLLDGDLRHTVDFRQVYATILDQWLNCDSQRVLGAKFAHLPLF